MGMQPSAAPGMPAALSSFLGRRRELEELRALMSATRLLTLVGTGGVGKTRLALETARLSDRDFPGGSWLVDLARTESPELVGATIAESVSATESPGTSALERAADRLATGRQLLVLDNCEHVLADAASACRHLLTNCAGLTVVATSRVPLGVEGEQVWWSPGLGVPGDGTGDLEAIAVTDSVRLFCDRAQSTISSFRLSESNVTEIATICRRLEGLPLALELAAGWVRVLSVKDIANRLDDPVLLGRGGATHQPGHRTMYAALDRSNQLLSDAQRIGFYRLSVFVGGFAMSGAEAVLSDLPNEVTPLEIVASLVECSLISADTAVDETRYRLLEPVRQYAAEKICGRPDDERATRIEHLRWLADMAETADEHILGGPDLLWLQRLDVELANIRAALAWGFEECPTLAARLCAGLVTFCVVRGTFAEGLTWARRAIQQTEGLLHARCLYMAGLLSYHVDDGNSAKEYLVRARKLLVSRTSPELAMVAFTESLVAGACNGDYAAMRSYAEESLRLARSNNDPAREMYALEALAWQTGKDGDRQQAIALLRERIGIARRLQNQWTVGQSLSQIADLALEMDDSDTALRAVREGLQSTVAVHAHGQDSIWVAYLLENAAALAIQRGDGPSGLRLLGATHAVFERMRFALTAEEEARRHELLEAARSLVGNATADSVFAAGRVLGLQDALGYASVALSEEPADPDGLTNFHPDEPVTPVPPAPNGAGQTGRTGHANSFVREGEFWSLTYEGVVVRLKDSKGLRDIGRLLASPGSDIAAIDLAGVTTRGVAPKAGVVAELGLRLEGDAGAVLDEEARRQYRSRLIDLEEEAAEAEAANDPVRLSRTRDERDFLVAELRASVGLGGQGRRSLDPGERARKTVTWRIHDAMTRIDAAHPALGRHLRRSLRTGTYCRYDPVEAPGGRF